MLVFSYNLVCIYSYEIKCLKLSTDLNEILHTAIWVGQDIKR